MSPKERSNRFEGHRDVPDQRQPIHWLSTAAVILTCIWGGMCALLVVASTYFLEVFGELEFFGASGELQVVEQSIFLVFWGLPFVAFLFDVIAVKLGEYLLLIIHVCSVLIIGSYNCWVDDISGRCT